MCKRSRIGRVGVTGSTDAHAQEGDALKDNRKGSDSKHVGYNFIIVLK